MIIQQEPIRWPLWLKMAKSVCGTVASLMLHREFAINTLPRPRAKLKRRVTVDLQSKDVVRHPVLGKSDVSLLAPKCTARIFDVPCSDIGYTREELFITDASGRLKRFLRPVKV